MAAVQVSTPRSAWMLLFVALFAVSSAGAVLQSMTEIPPILRASWRMQGTALVLLPGFIFQLSKVCLLYTSPSPRDLSTSRMPSSA